MLAHLRVANLGVLVDASIDPSPGFTVITGETGAGKTLLLGGLRLVLGGPSDPKTVGPYDTVARVDGLFIGEDDLEFGASRTIPAEGRSRAHLEGSIVSAAVLAQRVGALVDVVGQHDQLSITRPSHVPGSDRRQSRRCRRRDPPVVPRGVEGPPGCAGATTAARWRRGRADPGAGAVPLSGGRDRRCGTRPRSRRGARRIGVTSPQHRRDQGAPRGDHASRRIDVGDHRRDGGEAAEGVGARPVPVTPGRSGRQPRRDRRRSGP